MNKFYKKLSSLWRKNRILLRFTSLLLVFALMVTCIPIMPVSAVAVSESSTQPQETINSEMSTTSTKPYVIGEDNGKRRENEKHFLMSDGSYVAAMYDTAVHFINDSGEYEEIDNSFEVSGEEYQTKKGKRKVKLAKKASAKKLVTIHETDYKISWGYEGAEKVTGQTVEIAEPTDENAEFAVKNISSQMKYLDVFDDVDLEYIISPDMVKENIILKSSSAQTAFTVNYDIGKLVASQKDERTIELLNGETVKYTISAPIMIDVNGQKSADLTLSLLEQKNGKLTVILSADSEWLNASDRAYPVIVDPATSTTSNSSILAHATACDYYSGDISAMEFDKYSFTGFYEEFGHMVSLYQFLSLPEIDSAAYITGAYFHLIPMIEDISESEQNARKVYVGAYEVLDNWVSDENYTLNYVPEYDDKIISEVFSYSQFTFDITLLAKKWYGVSLNSASNYGFCLNSFAANDFVMFVSPRHETGNARPVLQIAYINQAGIEDHFSYTEIGMGSGTALVNNATGNLVVGMPVISTVSENMPAAISLYYNATQANSHSEGKWGHGWRSNFDQRIDEIDNEELIEAGYKYTYTDSDGTVHYMIAVKDKANEYTDESGMGLTLIPTSSGYSLKSKDESECVFNSSGRLTKVNSAISSSSILLTYSNNLLSKITDGVGNALTIARNSDGTVKTITDSYNRKVSLSHSDSKLTKVGFYDGTSINITYDYGYLDTLTSIEGYLTDFVYAAIGSAYSTNRVASVVLKSMPNSAGVHSEAETYTFGYSNEGYTRVSDSTGQEITYVFDEFGRAESCFNEQGAATATYTKDQDNPKKNNKISSENSIQTPTENLLLNNSFESTSNWWSWTADTNSTAELSTSKVKLGNKSLKLSSTETTSGVTYFQVYYPKTSGNYTYSVYYTIPDVALNGKGAQAMLALVDKNDNITYHTSSIVRERTNENWMRLSVTAYVNANAVKEIRLVNALRTTTGTVYFDCAQLEIGSAPSEYNMLTNSFFDNDLNGWSRDYGAVVYNSEYILENIYDPGNYPFEFSKIAMLNSGDSLYQTIPINQPSSKAVLNYSAYACALPTDYDNSGLILEIDFNFTDGTNEKITAKKFNPYNRSWQRSVGTVAPSSSNKNKTVETAIARIKYTDNNNFALVTGMQLSFDVSGKNYTYDANGNLATSMDISENGIKTTYDDKNRLTNKVMRDHAKYNYTYKDDTRLVESVTGPVTEEDDIRSDLYQKTDYTYNTYGQQTSSSRYNGNNEAVKIKSSSAYSSNGQHLISTTDEIGTVTTNSYDSYDRLSSINYGGKTTVNYSYDTSNRLTGVTQTDGTANSGVSVQYGYTNQALTSINHNGFNYKFDYNKFGSLLSTKIGTQPLLTNTYGTSDYNPTNNNIKVNTLIKSTYGNGDYVEHDYDKYGRIVETKRNGEVKYQYTYTVGGTLYMVRDIDNAKKYFYFYDSLGRLNDIQSSDGSRITVTYNADNKISKSQYTFGGETKEISYQYYLGGLPWYTFFGNGEYYYLDYDNFSRIGATRVYAPHLEQSFITSYGYYAPSSTTTSNLISRVSYSITDGNGFDGFEYNYDSLGNITNIVNHYYSASDSQYEYDHLNQLVRENNGITGKTITYAYDGGGNIISKTEYPYTTESLDGLTGNVVQYTYGDSNWKDKLTAYNGNAITYDAIGNPMNYYNGTTFEWGNGRSLIRATKADGTYMSYRYNDDGIRIRKSVNGTATDFFLNGSDIIAQKTGNNIIWFNYDASGQRVSFEYGNECYYYVYNAQGDVIGLLDSSFEPVVTYKYDSWGKLISISGSGADTVGVINPFRYRGYYYDTETGLYYLNSRYYDPEVGRFINADGYISTGQGVLASNMFAYCENNPVNRVDPTGQFWITALVVTAVVAVCTFTLSGCSSNNKKAPDPEPYSNQANCYAYAMKLENDPRTGRPFTRKPQPGEFSENGLTARDLRGNSETVKKAINTKVSADAKVLNLNYTEVNSADHVPKAGNWVVALAYATNGSDYHWWRKNEDGTWSHKPGSTPIIHWDASGNTITDPGNCNRGIYDGFLGYYEVGPN